MKHYKTIAILAIFIVLFQIQNAKSQLGPSINYQHTSKVDDMFIAIDIPNHTSHSEFGLLDEFNGVKLRSGIRKTQNAVKLDYIYNFAVLSYLSFIRIPNIKNDEFGGILLDGPILDYGYSTFLTLSYKGPEVSNMGIYQKDYNWSSVGVDLLYKYVKFSLETPSFYSRFSYILTPSTIQNNPNYFADIDSSSNTNFCFETKLMNTTKLSRYVNNADIDLMLVTYYRQFYNKLSQYEFSSSLLYRYFNRRTPFIYNFQMGYLRYGAKNKWNETITLNLGITYDLLL